MKKCDFCKKYDPIGGINGPTCEAFAGSHYCEDAIAKMTEVLKNMKVSPTPKKGEPSDEVVKQLMHQYFGEYFEI